MRVHEASSQATGLDLLRARIRAARIAPALPHNLRVATWNIRRLGEGTRLPVSIEMIAMILRRFDLVSIVELCDDLTDMRRVLRALGSRWSIVFSDYLRDAAGNRERVGFVFDRERVTFTGLASCAEGERRLVGTKLVEDVPWWRPPFMASFRRGQRDLVMMACHVRWGSSVPARQRELVALGDWIVRRSKESGFAGSDLIVAGDFNVDGARPDALVALTERGLAIPPAFGHEAAATNLARDKRYDEILCSARGALRFSGRAGAVDFYAGNHRVLYPGRRMTKEAFTFQLSDHLPLWAELIA